MNRRLSHLSAQIDPERLPDPASAPAERLLIRSILIKLGPRAGCSLWDCPIAFLAVAAGIIAACLLMLLAPMPAAGAAHPAVVAGPVIVSGQLTVEKTGDPVPGAPLQLLPNAVRPAPNGAAPVSIVQTLANGSFVIRAPHPGKYLLVIDIPQFFRFEREITVPAAGLNGLNVQLNRPPALELTITAPDGKPVSGVPARAWLVVTPRGQATAAQISWITEPRVADGHLSIAPNRALGLAAPGAFGVSVRVPGVGYGVVTGAAWPTQPVAIQLRPGVSASGRVVEADGKPGAHVQVSVGGAAVDVPTRFLQGWVETTTDDNGAFTITDLAPGRYEVRAQFHDGYRSRFFDAAPGAPPVNLSDTGRDMPPMGLHAWNGMQPNGGVGLTLASPLGAPAGASIRVSGHILDHGDAAKPVEGMPVAVYLQTSAPDGGMGGYGLPLDVNVSDRDGLVSLQVPAPGVYRLVTGYGGSDEDYTEVSRTIKVPPAGLDNQVFAVSPRPTMQLQVETADGKPVASKPVEIYGSVNTPASGYGYSNTVTTDANGMGKFQLYTEVDTASVTGVDLALHAEGIGGAHIHLDSWPGGAVEVKLLSGRQIQGSVLGPADGPVNGAHVSVQLLIDDGRSPSFDSMGNASSGEDGAFTLTGLPPGYYAVTAASDGSSSTTIIVDAREASPQPVRLQLKTGLTITGRVLDAAGFTVPNLQIRVFRLDNQYSYPYFQQTNRTNVSTDATGRFRVAGLRPGLYYLDAQTQDQRFATAHLELAPGNPADITLRFGAGVSVAIRVLDAEGKPVAGAQVSNFRMTPQDWALSWTGGPAVTTGDDGRCVLENLTPGRYLLVATAPGIGRMQRLVNIGAHNPAIIITPGDHL